MHRWRLHTGGVHLERRRVNYVGVITSVVFSAVGVPVVNSVDNRGEGCHSTSVRVLLTHRGLGPRLAGGGAAGLWYVAQARGSLTVIEDAHGLTDQASGRKPEEPDAESDGVEHMASTALDDEIPAILRPITEELNRRAVSMAGDQAEDPFVLGVARRIVIKEAMARIAFDDYLDEMASV
jgi:hypothetical protein